MKPVRSFEDFLPLALNERLTGNEKADFPENYRNGKEEIILQDILQKLQIYEQRNLKIADIGCGCSPLSFLILEDCISRNNQFVGIDHLEVLNHLPDHPNILKLAGKFPQHFYQWIRKEAETFDCVIAYSVLQYEFWAGNAFEWIDSALRLLKSGGQLFLGDIPNDSKRNRFFRSESGITFHQEFMKSQELPPQNLIEPRADFPTDDWILEILRCYRQKGYETYVLPQNAGLAMSNRREDILIRKW